MNAQMLNLLARVDGMPVELIPAQRLWPAPSARPTTLSRRAQQHQARQTLVVHHAPLPAWAKGLVEEPVEDLEIHADLQAAGLL